MWLRLCFLVASLSITVVYSGSNNAGDSTYHGSSGAWSNISLITKYNAPWIHLAYLVADNNLDSAAVSDLNEMLDNNATADELTLVVYVDRCLDYDCDMGYLLPIDGIIDYYTGESVNGLFNNSKILQKINHKWYQMYDFENELDSMLVSNVEGFISLFSQFEKTGRYFFLEFWDHGGAWMGFGDDENTALSNGTDAWNLDLLFDAIKTGLKQTSLPRLDLFGFDACMMADLSILTLIEDELTRYYIASEVSEPGEGWQYNGLTPVNHSTGRVTTPFQYAKAIIQSYVYQSPNIVAPDEGAGYTLAVFDMDIMNAFTTEFERLTQAISTAIAALDYGMLVAFERAVAATEAVDDQIFIYDLGQFLDALYKNNVFFDTCFPRLLSLSESVGAYYDKAILHFDTDWLRSDLTGASLFLAFNSYAIDYYQNYNSDENSADFLSLLTGVQNALTLLSSESAANFTNDTCWVDIPSNLTFYLGEPRLKYSAYYGLWSCSAEVSSLISSIDAYIVWEEAHYTINGSQVGIDAILSILDAQMVDYTTVHSEVNVLWDSYSPKFTSDGSDSIWSTAKLESVETNSDGFAEAYIAKFDVLLYTYEGADSILNLPKFDANASTFPLCYSGVNASQGWIELSVVFSRNGDAPIVSDLHLYEIDGWMGTVAEVDPNAQLIVLGVAILNLWGTNYNYYGNTSVLWTDLSVQFDDLTQSNNPIQLRLSAHSIIGDSALRYVQFTNVSSDAYSTWAPTDEPQTTTNEVMTTNTGGKPSNKSGLDSVKGWMWLLIAIVLFVIALLCTVLWLRARNAITHETTQMGAERYVQFAT